MSCTKMSFKHIDPVKHRYISIYPWGTEVACNRLVEMGQNMVILIELARKPFPVVFTVYYWTLLRPGARILCL